MHNEQLMGIRREEEMEMSDDDMEDAPDSKDSEDLSTYLTFTPQPSCQDALIGVRLNDGCVSVEMLNQSSPICETKICTFQHSR